MVPVCRGESPSEADSNLLDTARKVEMYGIKFHPAKVPQLLYSVGGFILTRKKHFRSNNYSILFLIGQELPEFFLLYEDN